MLRVQIQWKSRAALSLNKRVTCSILLCFPIGFPLSGIKLVNFETKSINLDQNEEDEDDAKKCTSQNTLFTKLFTEQISWWIPLALLQCIINNKEGDCRYCDSVTL